MLQLEVSKVDEKSNKAKIIFLTQNLMPTDCGDEAVRIMTEFLLNCKQVPEFSQDFMTCMKSKVAKMDLQVACQVFKVSFYLF